MARQRGTIADPTPSGARRFQVRMSPRDFAAMKFLMDRHMHNWAAETVRYALREQHSRGDPKVRASEVPKLRDGVLERWCCWLRPADFEAATSAARSWGMASLADAVRLALRAQAVTEGFDG